MSRPLNGRHLYDIWIFSITLQDRYAWHQAPNGPLFVADI